MKYSMKISIHNYILMKSYRAQLLTVEWLSSGHITSKSQVVQQDQNMTATS